VLQALSGDWIRRSAAEDQIQFKVSVSRALLAWSRDDARAYFNQALEVASELGDDVYDRWEAILLIADRAGERSKRDDATAYRLMRAGEVADSRLDDHFPWEGTIKALARLSPPSAVAAVSRWDDRNVGRFGRLLPALLDTLTDAAELDALTIMAFTALSAGWDFVALTRDALAAAGSRDRRQRLIKLIVPILHRRGAALSSWVAIAKLARTHGVRDPDLARGLAEACAEAAWSKARRTSATLGAPPTPNAKRAFWRRILRGLVFNEVKDALVARQRLRAGKRLWPSDGLWARIFDSLPSGSEIAFVRALAAEPALDVYDWRAITKSIPASWLDRPGLRGAVQDAFRTIFGRYAADVSRSPKFQKLPLEDAMRGAGLTEADLVQAALCQRAEQTRPASPGEFYQTVGLIAAMVTPDEAHDALGFALERIEASFDGTREGDGGWRAELVPPSTVDEAVAGALWAQLGSTAIARRWEAAHAVRRLASLGRSDILQGLVRCACSDSAGPFRDPRLPFYGLHARHFLLLALARIAVDDASVVAPFCNVLRTWCAPEVGHVQIRGLAAQIVGRIVAAGLAPALPQSERDRLAAINEPPRRQRAAAPRPAARAAKSPRRHAPRFILHHDFDRYWIEPLARLFNLTVPAVTRQVEKKITQLRGQKAFATWRDDPRHALKIYRDERTWSSGGSQPAVEDLSFYLAYHALMEVAGDLLASHAVRQDRTDDRCAFERWLAGYTLTQPEGRWLADRADPEPHIAPAWPPPADEDVWSWMIGRPDLDRAFGLQDRALVVRGHWRAVRSEFAERVWVESALVDPSRSAALVAALQTTDDPCEIVFPSGESHADIAHPNYTLRGWVQNQGFDRGLDSYDPLADRLSWPGMTPMDWVRDTFALKCDPDGRVWQDGRGQTVFRSQAWADSGAVGDQPETPHGERLIVPRDALETLLTQAGLELIVLVQIGRERRKSVYERADEDREPTRVFDYFNLYLVKPNGDIVTL
jgi:hypothetical protein